MLIADDLQFNLDGMKLVLDDFKNVFYQDALDG